jgi:hypothetical protein
MKARRLLLATLFVFLSAAAAEAQIGIYAGFTGAFLDPTNATIFGPLIGVYAQTGRFIAIGADVRGSFLNYDGNQFYTGAAGPRIAFKPEILPIKPYVEALAGIASYTGGSSINYQIIGGIDATILPRIDWRVVEFDYSAVYNNSLNAKSLTTGLVFRLP